MVPFSANTGAAAFVRGSVTYILFDERRPIDLAGLRSDQLFAGATLRLLPTATLMQVRLPPNRAISLAETPQGWRIAILATTPRLQPIVPTKAEGTVTLTADAPGQEIAIADPDTGGTLLIGTQRRAGQAVLTSRRGAEFALHATLQGVVAEALADRVALRAIPAGFSLNGGPDGLSLAPAARSDDADEVGLSLTRRFQFPGMSHDDLSEHLIEQLNEIAAVPAQARGPHRLVAARTLLALGMGVEAQAMLRLAAGQAPSEGMSQELAGLAGVAALLAGRPEESGSLLDERLTGTDEIALWRAIRDAMRQDASARPAEVMAATGALALSYPAPIRDRVLPLITETMAIGGAPAQAQALLNQRKDDPNLVFARALASEMQGDKKAALAAYDVISDGRDQRDHARAAARAVDLRLSLGELDAAGAADGMERLLYSWRGDSFELDLRDRLATLDQQAGRWRAALAVRRAIEAEFPDSAAVAHVKLQESFAALLKDDAADRLAPLDLVTLVDDNADLMLATTDGEAIRARLADRLLALDLPKRADPLLDKLMRASPTTVGRATFGQRLAALRLRDGDAAGALGALEASAASDLPAPLERNRVLLGAQANAKRGDVNAASAALAALGTPEADAARAGILEAARDWPAAMQALRAYVTKTVPQTGALDPAQQRTVLRLATAAAQAGDDASLAALRTQELTRMGDGPMADMFRLLTADPVRATTDLKRAANEVSLARGLPADLKALDTALAR